MLSFIVMKESRVDKRKRIHRSERSGHAGSSQIVADALSLIRPANAENVRPSLRGFHCAVFA